MAIRIDEYGHIIRDDSEQQHSNSTNTNTQNGASGSSGDRLFIMPNSTQMENPSPVALERPRRHNGLIGILVAIGIVIFLVVAIKSCSSSNRNAGYSNGSQQAHSSYNNNGTSIGSDSNLGSKSNNSTSKADNSTDNNTDYDNHGEAMQEPEKTLRSYSVSETPRESLNVDGIFVGETISISEEPAVSFSGSVSEDNKKQSFSYTAPRDGRYRLDLIDVNANASIRLMAWNANGENVIDTYSGGAYATFNANETYDIQARYYSGSSSFTISIGVQKPTTDISSATIINDQISFSDQKNLYVFTAPIDGKYRFDLTDVNANNTFRLMMWDQQENNIMDTYSGGDDVTLTGGETYHIQVRHYSGTGSYRMVIGFQKPTVDITNYGVINDSIEYEDQKNIYTFTAPIEGRYRFDLTEVNANNTFRLMMWDRLDNNILDTYSGGAYVSLEAGETYRMQVRHYSGYGSYKMTIGYQKESVDLSDLDVVYDSITFEDQKNVYFYTPSVSGKYTLSLADYNSSCSLRLMAWDNLENNIIDTYNSQGTATLEAGKTYQIQVRHYSGYSSYSLTIEKNNS